MKDKLGDLIPWLEKFLDTFAKTNPDDDHDEAERRLELTRFASQQKLLVSSRLIPIIDLLEASGNERKHCQTREGWIGSSIRSGTLGRSPNS